MLYKNEYDWENAYDYDDKWNDNMDEYYESVNKSKSLMLNVQLMQYEKKTI